MKEIAGIVAIVIGMILSLIGMWVLISEIVSKIRYRGRIRAGAHEARKVERERTAMARRLAIQKGMAIEISNILDAARDNAKKNKYALISVRADVTPYLVSIVGGSFCITITIDFGRRHQLLVEDEDGKVIMEFLTAKEGIRWIRRELVWRIFGIWNG